MTPKTDTVQCPGTVRLVEFTAHYEEVRARYESAKAEFDALTVAIKAEIFDAANLIAAEGDAPAAFYQSPHLGYPLKLAYRTSDRVDTRALRKALPDIAEQFTRTSGAWYLTRVC